MESQVNNKKRGKYCQNCGNLIDEKAIMCPKCGVMVDNIYQKIYKKDRVRFGTMAIISLVTGILSLPSSIVGVGLLFGIAAIVLGILDLKNINKGKSGSQNRGFDIAGIFCGGVGILSSVIFIAIIIMDTLRIGIY